MFEAAARRSGMTIERTLDEASIAYRFAIDVPVHDEKRIARARFEDGRGADPRIHVDGPRCLRHRFRNDSLCMWFGPDAESERWVVGDGLLELVGHIEVHAYCEAECRAGWRWPKAEAPGDHPRPRHCPTCRGRGS